MPSPLALLLCLGCPLFLLLPEIHRCTGEVSNAESEAMVKTVIDTILNSDVELQRLAKIVIDRLTPDKIVQLLEKSSKRFLVSE